MQYGRGRMLGQILVVLIVSTAILTPAGARTPGEGNAFNAESLAILREIEPELQRFVDQQPRRPGQDARIPVRITPDQASGVIWVDLGPGYLPAGQMEFDEGFGEMVRAVNMELENYVTGQLTFGGIRARIGGRTLGEIYPPEHLRGLKAEGKKPKGVGLEGSGR